MIRTIHIPKAQELVIVGDIHENEYHFDQMIERAQIGTKRILVSVGDVYDKGAGHHVAERIIRKIKALDETGWAYMVRGNHEHRVIKNYKSNGKKLTPELQWCKNLPLALSFIFSNQNRITVVHGGVTPTHTWDNISTNTDVMYVRSLDEGDLPIPLVWIEEDGQMKLRAERSGVPWHERYDGRFGYIVSGHDSQKDGVVKYYKYSCNIDTACYHTGILAGAIINQGTLKDMILVENK